MILYELSVFLCLLANLHNLGKCSPTKIFSKPKNFCKIFTPKTREKRVAALSCEGLCSSLVTVTYLFVTSCYLLWAIGWIWSVYVFRVTAWPGAVRSKCCVSFAMVVRAAANGPMKIVLSPQRRILCFARRLNKQRLIDCLASHGTQISINTFDMETQRRIFGPSDDVKSIQSWKRRLFETWAGKAVLDAAKW